MKFHILLPLLLLLSCQDLKKEKQIMQLNQCEKTVDSIREVYFTNKNDTLSNIVRTVRTVELRIKQNYNSDTINRELGKKVNEYKMIRKKIGPISNMKSQIEKGTLEEKEVLKNLRLDIENGAGDKAKYDEYILFEKNKIQQLKNVLNEMLIGQDKCVESYIRLHNELNSFSLSLLKK